jgi:hypothetical protein
MAKPGKASGSGSPVRVTVSPVLREELKRLYLSRILLSGRTTKPATMRGIMDAAVLALVERLQRQSVRFVVTPPKVIHVSVRVGAASYALARKASKRMDVQLATFLRTALSLYVRQHAADILKIPRRS